LPSRAFLDLAVADDGDDARAGVAARAHADGAAHGDVDAVAERAGRMLDVRHGVAHVASEERAIAVVGLEQLEGQDAVVRHHGVGRAGAVALADDDARAVGVAVADLLRPSGGEGGDQHLDRGHGRAEVARAAAMQHLEDREPHGNGVG